MKPLTDKQKKERKARLAEIRQQVKEGSLVIRQMTAKERAKYAPKSDKPRKRAPAQKRGAPRKSGKARGRGR